MFEIAYEQIIGTRKEQEDYFATFHFDDGDLIILADGMGGYKGGKIASSCVVKSVIDSLKNCSDDIHYCFENAMYKAQKDLKNIIAQDQSLDKMGCTLIITLITNEKIIWLSVGDSLIYLKRDEKLKIVNKLHAVDNILTSAICKEDIIEFEYKQMPLQKNDILLVCSDGIQTLDTNEILKTLDQKTSKMIVSTLIENIQIKNSSHQDNTTILVLKEK